MKVKNLQSVAVASLLVATATLNARAWDGTGHMIIGQIAYDRLNDKARAHVDELASKLQRNGVPYNGVNICCWADDIKAQDADTPFRGHFKPWHYIDIGCLPTDPDVLGHPPTLTITNGDVVVALNHCVDLIKNKQTDALVPNESVALALVMHFVGDIHQPLHTTARYNPNPKPDDKYKDDAGGNGVTLANLADTQWPNLHTFWDEAYRAYYENGEVKRTARINEADAPNSPDLKGWLKNLDLNVPEKLDTHFDVKKWALEGHEIACTQVYGTLGEPYGAKDIKLKEEYVKQGTRTARHQLVVAGCRLAALLNDLYGQ
jgi:hypothetical protein